MSPEGHITFRKTNMTVKCKTIIETSISSKTTNKRARKSPRTPKLTDKMSLNPF